MKTNISNMVVRQLCHTVQCAFRWWWWWWWWWCVCSETVFSGSLWTIIIVGILTLSANKFNVRCCQWKVRYIFFMADISEFPWLTAIHYFVSDTSYSVLVPQRGLKTCKVLLFYEALILLSILMKILQEYCSVNTSFTNYSSYSITNSLSKLVLMIIIILCFIWKFVYIFYPFYSFSSSDLF